MTNDRPAQSVNAHRTVVACLGSSSTAGRGQAFDFIGELKRRPQNERFDFRNFGVGGDLAYNALQRLPQVMASRPAKAVVWVGANDVLALISPKVRRFFRISKHLPAEPSLEWFRANMQAIAHHLKQTSASVALCSLPPLGEDPASIVPFQSAFNRGIQEYSEAIRNIARQEDVSYIPLYEVLRAQIQASPGRAFTSFRFLPLYRDAFRALILQKTPDEVAQLNGWRFRSDGVHLNSRGGMIAADLIQQFLD